MMKRLNRKTVLYNITEAREQLEQIEETIKGKQKITEVDLQSMLEHAYHHLNFAWNIRHLPTKKSASLSNAEFDRWSKFPKEIEAYRIGRQSKRKVENQIETKPRAKRTAASKKRIYDKRG